MSKKYAHVEHRLAYRSITPDGKIWTETRSVSQLLSEAKKWNGPEELKLEMLDQKVVYHHIKVKSLKSAVGGIRGNS
jgi:hypothetical protein